MRTTRSHLRPTARILVVLLGVAGPLWSGAASGSGQDFTLDFVAAEPGSYDHSTGLGGEYDGGVIGVNVVESLDGGDFVCDDLVAFFTAVTVAGTATGTQSIEIDFSFDLAPTGAPGVGYTDLAYATFNSGDSGNLDLEGDETVVLIAENVGSTLDATVAVTGLDAGDQLIVLVVPALTCQPGQEPSGNLQARLVAARVTSPEPDPIPTGVLTVPMMNLSGILPNPATSAVVPSDGGLRADYNWPATCRVEGRPPGCHSGVDISSSVRNPTAAVYAIRAGTVLRASCVSGYGWSVVIDHGPVEGGLHMFGLYAHMGRGDGLSTLDDCGIPASSYLLVATGDAVAAGQQIGRQGNSGFPSGPGNGIQVHVSLSTSATYRLYDGLIDPKLCIGDPVYQGRQVENSGTCPAAA